MNKVTSESRIDPSQPDFVVYESLLSQLNNNFPQHQGLDSLEFNEAMLNPDVVKTEFSDRGITHLVPQVEPLSTFHWLHEPYYEKLFPQQMASGDLLHFSDIPGIDPGDAVKRRLAQLAQSQGVLVFDYPSSDEEYPHRVEELVHSIGARSQGIDTIGTQTYFAGAVTTKRDHPKRGTPLYFPDAFDHLVASGGFDQQANVDGVSLQRHITGSEADKMFRLYSDSYATISDHPCTQGLGPEEFRDMLGDTNISKLVYRKNGVAETICLVTNNLDQLSWVNSDYYKDKFPDKYKNGQVVWFPGIATDPKPEVAGHNFPAIAELLAKLVEVGDNEIMVVFDTPDINTGFLDKYIEAEVNRTPYANIDFSTLGVQQYCAINFAAQIV